MSYNNINNVSHINGQNGPYNGRIDNNSVKYGRNAISNYQEYTKKLGEPIDHNDLPNLESLQKDLLDLSSKEISPQSLDNFENWMNRQNEKLINGPLVAFKLKYLPEKNVIPHEINKEALLGASFEDLGKRESVPVSELTETLQNVMGDSVSAKAFDINNDGKIDCGENATAILIKDMADKHSTEEVLETGNIHLQASDIDGTISQKGETNFWSFLKKDSIPKTKQLITQIYNAFQLDEAKNKFLADKNNTIQ
ncbi:MAG: hypothetical protein WCK67_10950 [bacterium]